MRSSVVLSVLSILAVANAQSATDALEVKDNPTGVTYVANLPDNGLVRGSVSAVASSDGNGVSFAVSFKGLPSSGGPYGYHIHDQPVSANGSCLTTLAHLDPFRRGEDPVCDSSRPQTCQVGDLSGKYGKITSDPYEHRYFTPSSKPQYYNRMECLTSFYSYTDLFASTKSGIGAFFGNRSIVVHFPNKTRIACANFHLKSGNVTNITSTSAPTASSTNTPSGPSKAPTPDAATAGAMVPLSLLFSGFLAALML
ncbi:MAG: hypothetical protein M1840_008957 [Geoglossum simile]|nr:MAG: hypothetical protein M1840_008957 [Geoglossum simile]